MPSASRGAPLDYRIPSAQSVPLRQHELDETAVWRSTGRSTKASFMRARIFAAASAREFERRAVLHDIWDRAQIKEASNPRSKPALWNTVARVARDRGADPLDVFFDLAIEDDLNLVYMMPLLDINDERVARKFSDPRTMIGISDGGAHVDMLCNAGYPTYLIGTFVREAARSRWNTRSSASPRSRPRFSASPTADAQARDGRRHHDFRLRPHRIGRAPRSPPRSAGRRTPAGLAAEGIEYTIVNGQVLFENNQHSGALLGPGAAIGTPRDLTAEQRRGEDHGIVQSRIGGFAYDRTGGPVGPTARPEISR